MSQKFPAFYPITQVCVVADPQKCPPSYDLLMRSKDREADCDLWRESGMFKRYTRYLCFTRSFNIDNPDNMVLVALQILNEKDFPPTGFTTIDKTLDSEEKAFRKKQLCVKMVSRNSVSTAITDIVLLTKIKRPPEEYTLLGDINGILVCYKTGRVPPETQSFIHAANTIVANNITAATTSTAASAAAIPNKITLRPAPSPPVSKPQKPVPVPRSDVVQRQNDAARSDTFSFNVLTGIEFQVNPSISDGGNSSSLSTKLTPSVSYKSLNDINQEYQYNFSFEKSVLANCKTP